MKKFAAIILILILCFSLFGCQTQEQTPPPQQENDTAWYENIKQTKHVLRWTSCVVETESAYYYCAEDGIHAYDKATKKESLLTKEAALSLFLWEDSLYFATETAVKKRDLKSGAISEVWNLSMLKEEDASSLFSVNDFMLDENGLYVFVDGITVIFVSADTGSYEMISQDCSFLVPTEDGFYYTDHAEKTFSVYYRKDQTDTPTLVAGDGLYGSDPNKQIYIDQLTEINSAVYYKNRDEDAIYRLNPAGEDLCIAESQNSGELQILFETPKDALFYTEKTEDSCKIYKYTEGTGSKLIRECPTSYSIIAITDSAIFCKDRLNNQILFLEAN